MYAVDCKKGVKVRWSHGEIVEEGVICETDGSIFTDDCCVWVNFAGELSRCHIGSLKVIEKHLQDTQVKTERKYSKEEIVEYMESIGYYNVEYNIQDIDKYFSSDNEEERKAINLLKSKGYTVQK